jgi:hypothetical protein
MVWTGDGHNGEGNGTMNEVTKRIGIMTHDQTHRMICADLGITVDQMMANLYLQTKVSSLYERLRWDRSTKETLVTGEYEWRTAMFRKEIAVYMPSAYAMTGQMAFQF